MNYVGTLLVNNIVTLGSNSNDSPNITENNGVTIQADDTTDDLFTSNGRMEIWKAAIEQWKEAPILGNGYGDFYVKFDIEVNDEVSVIEYTNMHSGYLKLLNACGLWGFTTIMLFGAYYLFIYLKNVFKSKNIYIGMTMIIIHSCMYAAINELFILDRYISVFLLCAFLGLARKDLDE